MKRERKRRKTYIFGSSGESLSGGSFAEWFLSPDPFSLAGRKGVIRCSPLLRFSNLQIYCPGVTNLGIKSCRGG